MTVFFLHGVKQIITDKSWIQNWKHNLFVIRNPQFSSSGFDLIYLLETSWPWTEPGLRKLVPTTKLHIYLPLQQKKNYLSIYQSYNETIYHTYNKTTYLSTTPKKNKKKLPMYLPYNKTTCLPLLQQNYLTSAYLPLLQQNYLTSSYNKAIYISRIKYNQWLH